MERKRKIIAALADLKQDIAGPVPVDIVSKWNQGPKNADRQSDILKPYERHGYLVSTDSSGLSRLTAERSLLEVMKIVSEPKEVIFEMGRSLGGKGVGIWAADNSQMFYDESQVEAAKLVDSMAAAQKVIHQGLVQVGMGIHKGVFWEIGHGMFGPEVELLEAITEDFVSAKEIIISDTVQKDLQTKWPDILIQREDLKKASRLFFSVNYDDLGQQHQSFQLPSAQKITKDNFYPFPFSSEFFLALKNMGQGAAAEEQLQKYFVNKVVILIKVYHHKSALLLNELTDWVVINAVINEILVRYDVKLVKSNGDLGIFVADKDSEAVEFAEEVLLAMRSSNDKVSIGLARGDVLLFNLDDGGMDIAGGAVNEASKISEDIPEQNTLYAEDTVIVPAHHLAKFEPFALEKSGVILKGMRYRL